MGQPSSSSVSSTALQPPKAIHLPKAMTGKQNKTCIGTCISCNMVFYGFTLRMALIALENTVYLHISAVKHWYTCNQIKSA